MSIEDVLKPKKQRKLLALDGGGIRGVISLGFLVKLEDELRAKLNADDKFVLADYFDYIAGNSTGAIIATALALGWHARAVRDLYIDHGVEMFDKAWLIKKIYEGYQGKGLTTLLQEKFSEDGEGRKLYTLGSAPFKSLLMVVMRNATTDSPWPVSNNPLAMYNLRTKPDGTPRLDCNLDLPLWQLVRASTAAPTYFPPEVIKLGEHTFSFVDGGVTVYNNPAFHLFCMATTDCYKLNWTTGEDEMLLVSVGTGSVPTADPNSQMFGQTLLGAASNVPSALMAAANAQQDFLCRVFGRCLRGIEIDREIGTLEHPFPPRQNAENGVGFGPVTGKKLFTYIRYNVDLTPEGLKALGLGALDAASMQAMDNVAARNDMATIGDAAAEGQVDMDDYERFLPAATAAPPSW